MARLLPEIGLLVDILLSLFLHVDVDADDDGTCGQIRRLVFQKVRIVQHELANFKRNLPGKRRLIELQQSQVSVQRLKRRRQSHVEVQDYQDLRLHI